MEKEEIISLIWQNQVEEVKQFLKKLSPNEVLPKDKYGCTALYWAIKNSNPEITELLLKQGCSPLELNQDGNSSWAILFEKRSDEIFQLCKNSLDKNTFLPREKDGKNFLQKALEANESDWFQELMPLVNKESLFNLNEDGKSILHIAAAYSEEEIVERILEAKPELLNHVSKNKYSPLHTFCEYDQAKICKLVNKKFPNVDWDTKDTDGNSCLHYAVENDATQAIEFLISEKVDCTLLNNEGDSAFAIAVREKNHHSYKLIKTYLIEEILFKKESNPPLAENWIQFGKSQNIFKPEDLAQLKIL